MNLKYNLINIVYLNKFYEKNNLCYKKYKWLLL